MIILLKIRMDTLCLLHNVSVFLCFLSYDSYHVFWVKMTTLLRVSILVTTMLFNHSCDCHYINHCQPRNLISKCSLHWPIFRLQCQCPGRWKKCSGMAQNWVNYLSKIIRIRNVYDDFHFVDDVSKKKLFKTLGYKPNPSFRKKIPKTD